MSSIDTVPHQASWLAPGVQQQVMFVASQPVRH
jgi:hypothetical protein